ncbi:hypothetical protein H310_11269 [Aphanomyces invadans]|uniref:Secreted protein n=1 Tax=Aphanomyces invadans TaxID=157072 RepID=A0A024TN19_9STRA|nr:hypothetical protein H310_11269 [Aphanomyces invadans]ETV95388.1 hypothetical protein H310_11269 [Aphanomyces invadans]|eukprot:XP_008876089.1 hypothetical protein H310_11269 [Aphanomyces invadans]
MGVPHLDHVKSIAILLSTAWIAPTVPAMPFPKEARGDLVITAPDETRLALLCDQSTHVRPTCGCGDSKRLRRWQQQQRLVQQERPDLGSALQPWKATQANLPTFRRCSTATTHEAFTQACRRDRRLLHVVPPLWGKSAAPWFSLGVRRFAGGVVV